MSRLLLAAAPWSVAACIVDLPVEPTFQDDVLPILAANCVRCHGAPPIGGAPADVRLDSYDDLVVDEGDPRDPTDDVVARGAASLARFIPSRVRDPRAPMPPRFPLTDRHRELLITWSRGEPPDRTPRAGNASPTIAVEVTGRAGSAVGLRYRLADADRDLTVGSLRARGADADVLVAPLQSGTGELTWDTTALATGAYALIARVDDGAGWIELDAGTVTVETP